MPLHQKDESALMLIENVDTVSENVTGLLGRILPCWESFQ